MAIPRVVRSSFVILALLVGVTANAQRAPTVTCTAVAHDGFYILDFTVKNRFLEGEGSILVFGVRLNNGMGVAETPQVPQYDWEMNPNFFNPLDQGGPNVTFNNLWNAWPSSLVPGSSLGGFKSVLYSSRLPATVTWFAQAQGGTYNGNDITFGSPPYPAFVGETIPVLITARG